jgi:hypothetical protein
MNNGNMNTTGSYNAYGTSANVPTTVQGYMQRDYPAASNVMWQQQGDWYHATYNNNGRFDHVFYNEGGSSFTMALPVTQSYIPEEVIGRVGSMFGPAVYDVTMIKGANDQSLYHVRLLENGQLRSQFFGEDGSNVSDPFVNHLNTTDNNAGMNNGMMNNGSMNTNINNGSMNNGTSTGQNMNSTTGGTGTDMNTSTNSSTSTGSDMNTGSQNGSQVVEMKIKSEKNKTKIETKTADGKERKVKIKEGQMKVKEKD